MIEVAKQQEVVEQAGRALAQTQRELVTTQEAVAAVQSEVRRLNELPEMTESDLLEEANAKRQVRRLEEEAAKVASRVADAQTALKAAERQLLFTTRTATRNARIASEAALLARAEVMETELQALLVALKAKRAAEDSASYAVDGRYNNPVDAFGATANNGATHGATALERVGKGLALQQAIARQQRPVTVGPEVLA